MKTQSMYDLILKNINQVKENLGIKVISSYSGGDNVFQIDDDKNYVTYKLSFNPNYFDSNEECIGETLIDNCLVYYAIGEG